MLSFAFSDHNYLNREDYFTLHLDAVQTPLYMAHSQKFATLVPKEIQQSRLFVGAILDSKGNVLYFTDSLLAMFSENQPKHQLHYTDIIFSEDIERVRDALTLCLVGKTVSSINVRMQARPGRPVQQVLWEFSPASESTGDEALVLCIGTRLQVIEPMRKVGNQDGDEEVINNLLRRNRDLEQFANIVSHNIRSPLANIMGLSRLLNIGLSEEDKQTALSGINTSAKKLEGVIKDLSEVLQIRKSNNGLRVEIDLDSLVEDICLSISALIERKNGKIICDFAGAPVIQGVRSYLSSIILNLITNALKYSRPEIAPIITIKSSTQDNILTLCVSDNGIGIDLEKHGTDMFGLYKRFNDTVEGKGLGLYMVKTQTEALNGKIEVESQLGVGTTFIITIPQ